MPTTAQTNPTDVIGRRTVAAIIDWLIISVPTFLWSTASFEYVENPRSGFCDDFMDQANGICLSIGDRAYFSEGVAIGPSLLGFALMVGIYIVMQGLTGMTPGKALLGIRTVKEDGAAPGIGKAFIRTLLFIVDNLPCIPLVGFITALTSTGHRRVGDMAAKTFVVKASAMGTPVQVPGLTTPQAAPGYAMAGAAPGGWGAPAAPPQQGWAPPTAPPATSPDPGQVGWGGPAPAPGEQPAAPGWPTPQPDAPSGTDPDATTVSGPLASDPTSVAPSPAEPVQEPQAAPAPSAPEPQWDEARGTYIQWDPAQQRWLQWDDTAKVWSIIPGQ